MRISHFILLQLISFAAIQPTWAQLKCVGLFAAENQNHRIILQSNPGSLLKEMHWRVGLLGFPILFFAQKQYVRPVLFSKDKIETHTWENFYGNPDKAGDIRWAPQQLPPNLKKLFSIGAYRSDFTEAADAKSNEVLVVSAPTVPEINAGLSLLEKASAKEHEPLDIFKFYPATNIVSGIDYIKNIAIDKTFPMSSRGALFEHDYNYHFLSNLVTPSYVVRAIQKRAQIIMLFHQYVLLHAKEYKELETLEKYFNNRLLKTATERMDQTGNLFVHLYINSKINEANRPEILKYLLNRIFFNEQNPVGYLNQLVENSRMGPLFGYANYKAEFDKLYANFSETIPDSFRQTDLDDSFFSDMTILQTQARDHLRRLDRLAGNHLQNLPLP